MYFQEKTEGSFNKKSLQQRKCFEIQTNETANCSESKKKGNKTADVVMIILHVCKRKYINGSRFMAIFRYSVDSFAALFHEENKNDLELELQENAFWGSKLHKCSL